MKTFLWLATAVAAAFSVEAQEREGEDRPAVRVQWENNLLTVTHPAIPERFLEVNYLEAFCRPGSTDRDWAETVIPHRTEKVSEEEDGTGLVLRSLLEDGVEVEHRIETDADTVRFRLEAFNPTDRASEAHWAQPCVRVHRFTGDESRPDTETYLPRCFVFIDGELTRMPMDPWATRARYVPGQVWRPAQVDPDDVNPRPVNAKSPSNGLIGCFSEDERWIFATAWEPYQELFQGVLCCLHSDFRLGGLEPGERKTVRGVIYLTPNDVDALLERYRNDFPGQEEER
ncbi:MAG TPA: hypothetical protein VMN36_01145 [Verrucomicrobiales bacterium]|nr:hypothetical protein [Verrucomicrobiales bacterium]